MSMFESLIGNVVSSVFGGGDSKESSGSSGNAGAAYAKAIEASNKTSQGFLKKAITMAAEGRSGSKTNLEPKQQERSKYTEDLITLYRNADTESTRQALIKQLRNNGNHRIALNLESSLPEEKEA